MEIQFVKMTKTKLQRLFTKKLQQVQKIQNRFYQSIQEQIMFQPNSIRSLLKKRNMSKLSQTENLNEEKQKFSKTFTDFSTVSKNSTDPDLQSVIEAKMMIKQIDHQVSNIRIWRQNQKQLLQQKLKNNQQVFNLSKQEYEKYVDQKLSQQLFQNQKLIEKMKIQQNMFNRNRQNILNGSEDIANSQTLQSSQGGQQCDWENNLYDPELMANITSADDRINQKKYKKSQGNEGLEDRHQAFLNSVHQLSSSDIFVKRSKYDQNNEGKDKNQPKNNVDKDQLRKELDDIEKELRQMQELMKD